MPTSLITHNVLIAVENQLQPSWIEVPQNKVAHLEASLIVN